MSTAAKTLKALADKTRREILMLLKKNTRMAAGDIAASFSMTQATVSHHLSILIDAELVNTEKIGKYIYYEINTSIFQDLLQWIMELVGGDEDEKETHE